ncbi:nuclear transport factor 2 family protein [Spirosoma luteum]|uniref:nuclear transport factor 2 family protein n=1 Tax=Spirosoma luteum TaxID=431553 RepID=UPI000371DB1A|nr:nuclear transport factor 2 family protein [Spirosoma luteum]
MKTLIAFALILTVSFVRAQTPVSPSAGAVAAKKTISGVEKAVLAAEKQRFEAQMKKDYAMLDRVLADDLVYNHSNGNTDNKQSYIQSIRDGKSQYDSIESQGQEVRVYGNTAIINGKCLIKATNNGETINTTLKYTDVYVRKGNQWQMVTWQSLRVPN